MGPDFKFYKRRPTCDSTKKVLDTKDNTDGQTVDSGKSALGANMYTYLKFGLPRVFPPSRGPRDGSSGYDSSDDGSPYLRRAGAHLRTRSDPDFRSSHPPIHLHYRAHPGHGARPGPPPGGGPGGAPPEGWQRGRSISEANLLSQEAHLRHLEHRRSVHDLRSPAALAAHYRDEYQGVTNPRRRISKAGSHASLAHSRRSAVPHREDASAMGSHLGPVSEVSGPTSVPPGVPTVPTGPRMPYYTHLPDPGDAAGVFKYPHIQVRGLEVESSSNSKLLLLAGISFEAHGGEIMAVMATSEEEGTTLLDVLAGRSTRGKIRGDVLLNGQSVRSQQLRDRVAYVQSDSHLSPDLTVRQTLSFHHHLRRSPTQAGKLDTKNRINALVEDLGLDQVRHTKVGSLTTSERRRLNVACHLLLDTDIVVLDQPTHGMDIFDTFFLVEFLRQWAGGNTVTGMTIPGVSGGRIVILTLHPPTYEIFTMLSRVALISAGRLMFSGRRRDMLPYFALVEYPCPAYKNPSDYYLDLVTLDDLSAEAMLESSQRIEQLAEVFQRRQEPLSDPGPPIALPAKIRQANILTQVFMLIMRALTYTQPLSLVCWLTRALLAAAMSVIVGTIFWSVPTTDPYFVQNDRIGFHATMAFLAPWPTLLLLSLGEVHHERWAVHRDVRDRLYSRFLYIITKITYNLPASAGVWLAYLVPAYLMSGLHIQGEDYNAFSVYVGLMLLYLLSMQMMLTAFGHLLRSYNLAAILAGLLFTALALVSGFTVHQADLGFWCQWLDIASPAHWILPVLVTREYRKDAIPTNFATLACRKKQVQHQDIIVQLPCLPPNTTAAQEFLGLLTDPHLPPYMPPLAAFVFWFICFLVTMGAFLVCRYQPRPSRNNPNKP
ncbi:Uncharacterized protein GBIM_13508 [Gryllus bimaculatus]|nr:Uncharacterized protein GBIM_13508 [Gryllus bimaculatus]